MNAALASVLMRYPHSVRPTREPVPLGNAGGLSGARLWRFETDRGPLAVRLWPGGQVCRAAIERIHGWLRRTAHLGFVPIPIAARDGRTVQQEGDHFWEVVPWMAGTAALSAPPHAQKVTAAFSALAAFHLVMNEVSPSATSPGLDSRLAEIEALIDGDLLAWRTVVSRDTSDPGARELALSWIDLAARLAPQILPEIRRSASQKVAIQPVIRDARPDHFLFTGDRVTGLVDFGAMGIDAVSTDLARLMGEWIGDDDSLRDQAIAAYSNIRPLSDAESTLIAIFTKAGDVLGGARWVRWKFVEGDPFADRTAVHSGLRRSITRCLKFAIRLERDPRS